MARKLPRLRRVIDAPALFAIGYGEIASSLYFALGVVALHALGFTPAVLLGAGAYFGLVALSYVEGTAAFRETGGAATFVRKAFNDLAGFVTGWALFLDYLIVIALSALFIPHYLGVAIGVDELYDEPWDTVFGVGVIAAITVVRLVRHSRLYRAVVVIAIVDLSTQVLLVGLGFALLFSPDALELGTDLGTAPAWDEIAFALPLALLAYTGLETVANLAEETRRPGRTLPRSLFPAIGLVVAVYVMIGLVGLSAFPAGGGSTALGEDWLRAPLMGIVDELGKELPAGAGDVLRVYVGLTGVLVLLAAATTSISGFARLAYSLGEHGQLPRAFGRLHRRTLVAPQAIVAAGVVAAALLVGATVVNEDTVLTLASLYSFGVLVAFGAAQLAVIRLRFTRPELRRPFKAPLGVRIGRGVLPLSAVLGLVLTVAVFVVALWTHPGARYAGPVWLAAGIVLYVVVRRAHGERLTERVVSTDEQRLPERRYRRILVPMKLGEIGEEMLATAIKIAQESGAAVEVLYVIRVPLDAPLEADDPEAEERAAASLAEARLLGADFGVQIDGSLVRARSIGSAIVEDARARGADLIVLGSAPRWRRQSRFFSPTVDYVLRRAPAEVLVVAFPQGVLEEA
ncbi:MAG TPA: universal stress protein [Gaiellaceae bacterium]|nr:universal stress protein [Gaiellaceae bacterium]